MAEVGGMNAILNRDQTEPFCPTNVVKKYNFWLDLTKKNFVSIRFAFIYPEALPISHNKKKVTHI